MADSAIKKAKIMPRAPRIRYTIQLEVEAGMEERLERIKSQLQWVKGSLRITSRTPMGNLMMMERLLDSFEESKQIGMERESHSSLFTSHSFLRREPSLTCDAATQTDVCEPYVLFDGENTTGCYDIHTESRPDEDYFIASTDTIQNLIRTMARYNGKCPLCGYYLDTQSFAFLRHGHAVRINMSCVAGHSLRWFSSSIISGKFTANLRYCIKSIFIVFVHSESRNFVSENTLTLFPPCRMVHGFSSTGLTETQYISYCKASNIGHVEQKYISTGNQLFVYVTFNFYLLVMTHLSMEEYKTSSKCVIVL